MNINMTPVSMSNLKIGGNTLYIKRDDLLPFCFGGNKVRIAEKFIDDMYRKNKNYMIGYGSTKSNLSRALACMCASKNIPCTIISVVNESDYEQTYNSQIVSQTGADVVMCTTENVQETIQNVMDSLSAKGFNPYYIYGDSFGNGNEAVPVEAYVKVYDEIVEQKKFLNCNFDYIFLACGTGMTYSGLLCGKAINKGTENIAGISISRSNEIEIPKLKKMILSYANQNNINISEKWLDENIICIDEYICDGYAKYNKRIEDIIENQMKIDGIPLDTTYVGKAFWGMCEYIKKNKITNKKILFIHTGGTTLYFDYISSLQFKTKQQVIQCNDKDKLLCFLNKIDNKLPVSLSSRVNIKDYTEKVIRYGKVLSIQNENFEIISAVLFYCNDEINKDAYVTFVGTLDEYQGNGFAKLLMNYMYNTAKESGMKKIHLDTENNNLKAISLYGKLGYVISEKSQKTHMIKEII